MRIHLPSRLKRFVTCFIGARRGATAVEFALVAAPLLGLILGTVELALVIMVTTSLETATETASRMVRTGEFQSSAANTRADFRNLVCNGMSWLQNQCNANLTVHVQVFNDFQTLAANQPLPGNSFLPPPNPPPPTCFAPGQPSDIVLVRVYFTWPLVAPLLTFMDNTGNGRRLISFATAFRNEPFNNNPPGGAAC